MIGAEPQTITSMTAQQCMIRIWGTCKSFQHGWGHLVELLSTSYTSLKHRSKSQVTQVSQVVLLVLLVLLQSNLTGVTSVHTLASLIKAEVPIDPAFNTSSIKPRGGDSMTAWQLTCILSSLPLFMSDMMFIPYLWMKVSVNLFRFCFLHKVHCLTFW